METTTKPIEVLLSRPHLEVTCRIACPDGTAIAAGVSLQRIQEITGITRTTIMRILGSPPRPAPRKPS